CLSYDNSLSARLF
nr:immunoglobulin light chain junction region [Macaca mulatta]MPN65292.1 immunoglobulin light chain junction region [Macaca mulatta]MPN65456.1 immunoglobulin light chain junction region [Macaca mulatta]MPN65464.1 immunoglobulin light chain junction region [Macaca mulatta]MPN65670.1 immunoglobulin light chain junction region [Macaca mulatta]